MADRKPNDVMIGTATGLSGYEIWLLRRNPEGVESITADNFFGPNSDQAATGNHTHSLATTTNPGFLSTADKAKIDVLEQTKLVAGGGTAGQVLTKLSATNFHFGWANPPAGGGGTSSGWAQYDTRAALQFANPTMVVGTSGYETDTLRWKLGNGTTAWNSLPYQDTPLTPGVITNPGTSVNFQFRPFATQIVNFTTVSLGATLNVTVNVPSSAPPTAHEGTMFVRVTNNSQGTVNVSVPGFNLVGDYFDGNLASTEAIEFSIWVLHGIWYAEGASNIPNGSITNTHLADMASGTIKGRWTAGNGTPEDLNGAQLRAIVDFAPPNVVTIGSNTTLTRAAHQGKVLVCTGAVTLTLTTSTDWDAHTSTEIRAQGGIVTIASTATVNAPGGLSIPQNNIATLVRETSADVYTLTFEGTAGEGGGGVIADGSVTNAKLANMSSGTFKGRISVSGGPPEDVTATDVRATLDVLPPVTVTIASSTTLTKAAHQGRELVCTTGLSLTVNASTDFDAHGYCWIKAEGGAVTVVASAPVNSVSGLTIPQYSSGRLARSTTSDTYTLSFFTPPASAGTGSGTYVDNLAALTATASPTDGQVVNVRGYATKGDGGGGEYMWIASETDHQMLSNVTVASGGSGYAVGDLLKVSGGAYSSLNQATVRVATLSGSAVATVSIVFVGQYSTTPGTSGIATTSSPGSGCTLNLTWVSHTNYGTRLPKNSGGTGRWVRTRDASGRVSVKVFGATGDGSTDDWQAIQRAIWATVPLYFPEGTYKVNQCLTWIGEKNVDIQGAKQDGWGVSQITLNKNTDEPLLHKFGMYMKWDGTYQFETGFAGISSSYREKLDLRQIKLISSAGDYGTCCEIIQATQCWIENTMFRAAFRGLTIGDQMADTTIINCEFDGDFNTRYAWNGTTGGTSNKTIARLYSWGLYLSGHTYCYGSSIVGNGTGLRLSGNGNTFIGARIEVNYYGIIFGTTRYQVGGAEGSTPARTIVDGISLEANTIAIRVEHLQTGTLSNFQIQGSGAAPPRPTSEIGLHLINSHATSKIVNGSANGTFDYGAFINDSRRPIEAFTASSTVNYARANSVFGQTGTDKPYFHLNDYRTELGPITAFSSLVLPGITGLNLRDGLIKSRNLGDVATPATSATSVSVTFPVEIGRSSYGISTIIASANASSTLSAGTYYYATTVLSKQAETGVLYSNTNTFEHKTVVVTSGQQVTLTFGGGSNSSLKRRIYRTAANGDVGNFMGYHHQDTISSNFVDTGQPFTGRAQPPINGSIMSCAEDDANYQIIATPTWATTVHVTNKTTTGFTLNFGTAAPAGQTCAWLLFRP